ncbi:ribonuclease III domain-containing protein [Aerosakkonema sp. BLCC-F183]|uniref:ribonuclease III domain-containing protein n=1 Tax=Aerosakkonema sp. BLCC-F183 TaxID=3342834 RepID=UPI0035BAA3FF
MAINIEAVKKAIAIPDFNQTKLLEIALTHSSYIYDNPSLNRQQQDLQEREYRRLAILGDSILGAVVIDYLHKKFPNFSQFTLTECKSKLVSRENAYEFARKLNLRQLCLLGRSENGKDESEQKDLFGEMFEALLGAIYLNFDRDFSPTRDWLVKHLIANAVDALLTDNSIVEQQLPADSLLAVSNMNADEATQVLWQMKGEIDSLVNDNEEFQKLLTWVKQKSLPVDSSYKPRKVRAFYLALIRILGSAFARNFDPTRGGSQARQFATNFSRANDIANDIALDLAFKANPHLSPANVLASISVINFEPELKQALQKLQAEMPDPKEEKESFDTWRKANGENWLKELRLAIGHNLQFSDKQKDLLKQYYDANKLLLECIGAANVTSEVKEEILESLFLPK